MVGIPPIQTFESHIALDEDLTFKVECSFSQEQGLTLTLTNKEEGKLFFVRTKSVASVLEMCESYNMEGKSMKVIFNSCKNLLTKPSDPSSHQQLGFMFFCPKNQNTFSYSTKFTSLNKEGSLSRDYSNPKALLYLKFECYDSLNEENFWFFLILEQEIVEKDVNDVSIEGASQHKDLVMMEARIRKLVESMSSKIAILMEENEYWKKKALEMGSQGQQKKQTSSLLKHVDPFLHPDSMPFVFGVLSRQEDCYSDNASLTNHLGQWYNSGADQMANIICGTHSFNNQYINFNTPPSIHFLQGSTGTFLYKEQHVVYNNSNCYQYPRAMLGMFFIKNSTAQPKTFTFYFGGTSGWSSGYEGASVFIGTPNADDNNRQRVSSVSWKNLWSISNANENLSTSTNVAVPANTTICLLLYTSSFYYTQNSNYVVLFSGWKCWNVRSAITNSGGLEIDHSMTLKAIQCQGSQNFYQLWHN
ncbi:hypothetical protein C9374_011853 [Naegleria lovaniensis]|uniref:Uncharacterized protein n=1 Tax=Naegleria lovaniensis TaxID=51637 RepID=A0AA88GE83_NAELO|nr:uncharacterized protein C9374_011853 [Naegleria lovaniensis]KAG2373764.1 hypothetical protein C9374_011853 [Naegleria lovaniensis]